MIRSNQSTAPLSEQLKQTHIDRRILPMFNDTRSRNVSVEKKFYDIVQPVGQNLLSKNQSFLINATSNSMISLSESYFVVNASIAPGMVAGTAQGDNNAPCQFASSLFLDQIKTRISNVDVSDQHPTGLYAYSSFQKGCLIKPREVDSIYHPSTYIMYVPDGSNPAKDRQPINGYVVESDRAAETLECLAPSTQSIDQCWVSLANQAPSSVSIASSFSNLNALYLKTLYENYPMPLDPAIAADIPTGNGNLEFVIQPRESIWMTGDYLPTNCQVQIDLTIADVSKYFQWIASSQPAFTLNSISLYLCRVQPKEEALLAVNQALNASPFTYPLMFSRTESYQIAAGARLSTISCLNGITPNLVMVQLVATDCFSRVISQSNPFSSGMLSAADAGGDISYPVINRMWLNVGSQMYPRNAMYLCNTTTANFQTVQASYKEYKKCCLDSDKPYLTYRHWLNHYQLYTFNLVNDDSPFDCSTDLTQSGNVQLNIEFGAATAYSYTAILTALQGAQVSIDKTRSVQREGF